MINNAMVGIKQAIPRTILIIDDDIHVRALLKRVFSTHFHVLCAANVEEGIGLFRENRPDLVITDYEMPNKDGIEGIRELRRICRTTSIIMLTGSATHDLIQLALAEGATECMPKPCNILALHAKVRSYTGADQTRDMVADPV